MITQSKKEEIQREIKTLQERISEMTSEADQVSKSIEARAGEITRLYVLRKDPAKLLAEQDEAAKKMRYIRDAIHICNKEIERLYGEITAKDREELINGKSQFHQLITSFIDNELKAAIEKYREIEKGYPVLLDLAGKARVGVMDSEFPFIEKHLHDTLFFYLNSNGLPYEIREREKTYKEIFKQARAAR